MRTGCWPPSYATPRATLREIPALVGEIIAGLSGTGDLATLEHDRTNLRAFGTSALEFETKYYVEDKTQLAADAAHNAILLALLDAFDARGIEIPFPVQTLRLDAAASEPGADRAAHPDDRAGA